MKLEEYIYNKSKMTLSSYRINDNSGFFQTQMVIGAFYKQFIYKEDVEKYNIDKKYLYYKKFDNQYIRAETYMIKVSFEKIYAEYLHIKGKIDYTEYEIEKKRRKLLKELYKLEHIIQNSNIKA